MQSFTVTEDCSNCLGRGKWIEDIHDARCDGSIDTVRYTCAACNGRGKERVTYYIGDDTCWKCEGKGRYSETKTEYGKNFFGEKTRKNVTSTQECEHCCGKGKQLLKLGHEKCAECRGEGTVDRWEKSLFSGEVLKTRTCPVCSGSKKGKSFYYRA